VPTAAPSASQRAYDLVKGRWLDGSLADGVLLSEGEVAGELGVSRTPVREAFLRLEAEGLLTLYPKRGALVTALSDRDGRDLLDARLLVERHCLERLLAPRPSAWAAGRDARPGVGRADDAAPAAATGGAGVAAGVLEDLRATVAEQRAAVADGDIGAYAEADRRMHRTWVAAAGNRVLLDLYDGLRDRQQRLTAQVLQHRARDPLAIIAEHEELLETLAAGDLPAMLERLERHVRATAGALLG
jgi:DNA-binding GntR family transcriptional regulator